MNSNNVLIVVPTFNGGELWGEVALAISNQDTEYQCLVIDSGSQDNTVELAVELGFIVKTINKSDFNHGKTRQIAVDSYPDKGIYVFLTQDALLAGNNEISKLVESFKNKSIGLAYGRQLPRHKSGPIEAHARLFNYPNLCRIATKKDISEIGIKAAFASNSFSAYRRSALDEVGGFPKNIIMGEDVYVAAKMILRGWGIYYMGNAKVYHSHEYTKKQEFKRYFDIGVFHSREPWIREYFGAAEGDGLRFVLSELKYIYRNKPALIISVFFRTIFKYLGYKAGFIENCLPVSIKSKLSMNKQYWL